MSKRYSTDFKALNAMYVFGVWLLRNTAYRVQLLISLMSEIAKYYCTLYTVAPHPSRGEGYLFEPSTLWV